MLEIANNMQSFLDAQTHRLAVLWQITRTDGTILRFTNHDKEISFLTYPYTPVGGYSNSALRHESGIKGQDRQYLGVITDDAITTDDLRAGLYRNAQVDEFYVDWRYPWAGYMHLMRYWINNVSFNGKIWEAEVVGLSAKIEPSIGDVFNKTCRVEFCSSSCGLSAATYTTDSVVVSEVTESRREFKATLGSLPSQSDDYYNYGKVTWTSGDNDGLKMTVKDYTDSTRLIELVLPMPFDIEAGDEFSIIAGCDTEAETCRDYDNIVNFRGYEFLQGTDHMMTTPDSSK